MISPNIEHIHYFTTVVETGSFTAAGQKLGRDRSSVGQAISNFEIDLGIQLFERQGRRITLTSEGKAIYRKARTVLQSYQAFCQFTENVTSNIELQLTIGVDDFVLPEEVNRIESAMRKQFPGLLVHWLQKPTDTLNHCLESGEADMVIRLFQNRNLPEAFHLRHLGDMALVAVTTSRVHAQNHSELRALPFILYSDLDKVLHTDRFEHVQHVPSRQWAMNILNAKPASTLLPQPLCGSPAYQRIRYHGTDNLLIRRIVVWHHGQSQGSAKRWLIEQLHGLMTCSEPQ